MKVYVSNHTVTKVEEKNVPDHVSGAGSNAVMTERSLGWFIHLENFFSICVGDDVPDIKPGDEVVLSVRRKQELQVPKPEKKITFAPDEKPQ